MNKNPTAKPNEGKNTKRPPGPPAWEYVCQNCQNKFTLPSPKGPSEERGRSCPRCGSKNIKWTGNVRVEACPPGG